MTKKKEQISTRNLLAALAGIALLVVAGALFYEWKKSGNGLLAQRGDSEIGEHGI